MPAEYKKLPTIVDPKKVRGVIIFDPNTHWAVAFVTSPCIAENRQAYMLRYKLDRNGSPLEDFHCSIVSTDLENREKPVDCDMEKIK